MSALQISISGACFKHATEVATAPVNMLDEQEVTARKFYKNSTIYNLIRFEQKYVCPYSYPHLKQTVHMKF